MKTASGDTDSTEEPGARDSLCGGGTIFGSGLGPSGRLPGTDVRAVRECQTVMIAGIGSAMAGTWLYGLLRSRLPH